jgi:hypothetical protein
MDEHSFRILLVAMYAASAILPTLGFVRLLVRTSRDIDKARKLVADRGHTSATFADFDEQHEDITRAPKAAQRDLLWDTLLVGVGLAFGAVASILSLTL